MEILSALLLIRLASALPIGVAAYYDLADLPLITATGPLHPSLSVVFALWSTRVACATAAVGAITAAGQWLALRHHSRADRAALFGFVILNTLLIQLACFVGRSFLLLGILAISTEVLMPLTGELAAWLRGRQHSVEHSA